MIEGMITRDSEERIVKIMLAIFNIGMFLFGAIFGVRILQVGRVKSPIARGISLGTAAHAIGTSRASEFGHIYGAYASLGLILNGVLTALLAPLILKWMGVI